MGIQLMEEVGMDALIQFGINLIVQFQGAGAWLAAPMKFFSFLGSEDFFFLVLPLVYWSIDSALGMRIGFILLTSRGVNDFFKMSMLGPRPYWVSDKVIGMASETSFGIPSGHSQIAASVWGICASYIRKAWAWAAAILLALFIGLSRLYLGVHFPHDVVFGWLLGFLTLWAFVKFWDPVAAWLKRLPWSEQILIALGVSLGFILVTTVIEMIQRDFVIPAEWVANATRNGGAAPDPFSLSGQISGAATLFGFAAGLVWMNLRGGWQVSGSVWTRAACYVVGLIGILIFWRGLEFIFPSDPNLVGFVFRYVRYALVGVWVTAGAPWTFRKLQLANNPKM